MPKFVVPQVATTAKNVSGPCASRVGAQVLAGEPPPVVGLDPDELGVHDVAGRGDRAVRPGRGRDAERAHALGGPVPGRRAGGVEGREVADGAARHEHPAGLRGHPDEVGDPAQRLVLGVDRARALEPGAGVDRGRPDDEVEHHGGVARRARDEGQVARVVGRQAGRREVLGEQPQRLEAAEALRGDRLADHRGERLRGRRPVERRLHPDALLGIRDDRLGERRELGVLVLLVRLPVHGGESRCAAASGGTPAGRPPCRRRRRGRPRRGRRGRPPPR